MVQIVKCPCGKIFAACREPECYSDAEWQIGMRKYIKKGCTVHTSESGKWNFEKCECPDMKPTPQLQLFNTQQ